MRSNIIFGLFGLALCILFGVQSCKVGKKYTQPDLDLPETYRGDTIAYFADTISIGRIDWRTFFQDPILKDLIDSALVNNNDMRTAILNIGIADQQVKQNRANFLPSVEAGVAQASRQWVSKDYISAPPSKYYGNGQREQPENMYLLTSYFGTDITFSWELDIWGKIRNRQDMVVADYLETHEARKAVQTNLIARVASGYFNLLMLDAKIEVAKRNVQLNDSTLQIIKLQYEAGEITALAIQQTESQRLLAASLVPELEQEIALQENALRILIGEMPAEINRGTSFDNLLDDATDVSLGSPLEIIRNRPDIRQAELSLIAANANMNVQQAMRYPALTLGGRFGVNAALPKNWFNIPGALLGQIGGDLTAPIFQNRRLKTEYEVAKLEREQAEIGLQQTVLEAVGEVSDAVITVGKQREQLEFAKQRVSNSQLAVRNAGLLFKGGYASYLEVITAQSSALDSDLALVELRQQYLASYIDLYRSLGGGWR